MRCATSFADPTKPVSFIVHRPGGDDVPTTRGPEGIEIEELERIDPDGMRFTEVPDA